MQTMNRCAYALASYDSKTQDHNLYIEKKMQLENACSEISKAAKILLSEADFVATHARYSNDKYLTICYYKGHLFAGFQDRKTNEVSLNDSSNTFVYMPKDTPQRLIERMTNAIKDTHQNRINAMSEQVKIMWKPFFPILDEIIEHENNFKKLPEGIQQTLVNRGDFEKQINNIISNTDNKALFLSKDVLPSHETLEATPFINANKNSSSISLNDKINLIQKTIKEQKGSKTHNQTYLNCKPTYR